MRKSREEAAQTRRRIVEAASCEFRKCGIVATGLNELMKAAGLTHGGFYKHFASKDQLVAEATTAALDALLEGLAAHPTINAATAALTTFIAISLAGEDMHEIPGMKSRT
jgi:TetR/AcrR family transcriptional regulator, transcriptional repressor for nem operon